MPRNSKHCIIKHINLQIYFPLISQESTEGYRNVTTTFQLKRHFQQICRKVDYISGLPHNHNYDSQDAQTSCTIRLNFQGEILFMSCKFHYRTSNNILSSLQLYVQQVDTHTGIRFPDKKHVLCCSLFSLIQY